ncbi:MAG: hypothetical protein JWO06_378 [Bacteroidota bacterium]|nr:hypothetical protein [Bacteroidota bacterium]
MRGYWLGGGTDFENVSYSISTFYEQTCRKPIPPGRTHVFAPVPERTKQQIFNLTIIYIFITIQIITQGQTPAWSGRQAWVCPTVL